MAVAVAVAVAVAAGGDGYRDDGQCGDSACRGQQSGSASNKPLDHVSVPPFVAITGPRTRQCGYPPTEDDPAKARNLCSGVCLDRLAAELRPEVGEVVVAAAEPRRL